MYSKHLAKKANYSMIMKLTWALILVAAIAKCNCQPVDPAFKVNLLCLSNLNLLSKKF